MFQTEAVEKIKTYFIFNSFFPENLTVYEITSVNMVQPDKPQKADALFMPDN
jgi:hypothetical protein